MKRYLIIAIITLMQACSYLTYVPEDAKEAEELQYMQSLRLYEYLYVINNNPLIFNDPNNKALNLLILEASKQLMLNIQAQSDLLGHTDNYKLSITKEANK